MTLAGGGRLAWDRLLLATGAEPRRLPLPGADLDGVLQLRDLADCERLRAVLAEGGPLVVVGAGWIGCEVAASARAAGVEVTLLERMDVPLEAVLGREMGAFYGDLHRERGVELLPGAAVEAFEGAGRVERVRLADGRAIDCAAVVVGVGVTPRTALAEAAGLAVDDGILVDERLRASAPGVHAAGDAARAAHPFFGRHGARRALGQRAQPGARRRRGACSAPTSPTTASPTSSPTSTTSGWSTRGSRARPTGWWCAATPRTRELVAFWLDDDGRVTAGMNVNVWDVTDDIRALVRSRARVDERRLADPGAPLADLAAAGRQ